MAPVLQISGTYVFFTVSVCASRVLVSGASCVRSSSLTPGEPSPLSFSSSMNLFWFGADECGGEM